MQIVISEYDRVNHHPTAKAKNKQVSLLDITGSQIRKI